MSLVIAVSSLSELAIRRRNAGGFQGCPHPVLGDVAVSREIVGLGVALLAKKRQMRFQVVVTRGQPLAMVGEGVERLLAGIEKIRNEALILRQDIAIADFDCLVIGRREFRILERA